MKRELYIYLSLVLTIAFMLISFYCKFEYYDFYNYPKAPNTPSILFGVAAFLSFVTYIILRLFSKK